jgi:hypothetical protein
MYQLSSSVSPETIPANGGIYAAFQYESLNCAQLAARLNMPETWVREHVRERVIDPIPHLKLGKYVRFLWGSPELAAWLERRMVSASTKKVVRSSGKERIQ